MVTDGFGVDGGAPLLCPTMGPRFHGEDGERVGNDGCVKVSVLGGEGLVR